MKKKVLILLFIILFTASGCGSKKVRTCHLEQENYMTQDIEFTTDKDNISKIKLTISFASELINTSELKTLTDEQKEQIRKSIMENLGLNTENTEGLNFSLDINDKMAFILDIDVNDKNMPLLKTLGLDLSDKDTNIDTVIKSLTSNGAKCD